jgi:futalosine hydrolase
MKILIIAATELEMSFFRAKMRGFNGLECICAITGVGLLSTLLKLTTEVNQHNPDIVVQLGIAGTFQDKNSIGTATVVKSESIPEMGVWEDNLYQDVFDMGLIPENTFPYQNKQLINPHENLIRACGLPEVNAISVNRITTTVTDIMLYSNNYKADIESMEGAALHYFCILNAIPFIQIRGISNLVGERNKSNWKIKASMDAVTESCHQLLSSFNAVS